MDPFSLLISFAAIIYIGLTIYLANQEVLGHPSAALRRLLVGAVSMTFFYGLMTLLQAIVPTTPPEAGVSLPPIDPTAATASFVLTAVLCLVALRVILSLTWRQRLKRWIGDTGTYNPDSSVHTAAIVLSLILLSVTFEQLVLSGGLSGMAEDVQSNGVSGELFFNALLWVMAAMLGVGFSIRRPLTATLERLGLRNPGVVYIILGVVIGLGMYALAVPLLYLWSKLVSPDVFAQQTAASEQMAMAINTLPLALAVSLAVAVGEEIFFRGALQPVFGLVPTSIFFALIHSQYTLTPATLLIFLVGFALGLVKQQWGTGTAIVTHFVYDFVQFALAIMSASALLR